jgi:hypothetical protein
MSLLLGKFRSLIHVTLAWGLVPVVRYLDLDLGLDLSVKNSSQTRSSHDFNLFYPLIKNRIVDNLNARLIFNHLLFCL